MDEFYLNSAVRYVELNPVKARLVRTAGEWPWSSARAHLAGSDDGVVQVAPMLSRVTDWTDYLSGEIGKQDELFARHERTGRPLGSDRFVEKLEGIAGRSLRPRKPGVKPKR